MKITSGDFSDAQVKALLREHLEAMHANSPPGHVFALDWSALQKPDINFYTGWQGDTLVAMGALKKLGHGNGEIKSMRVATPYLGQGHGERKLLHIIAQARRNCMNRLSLETGSGPAFEPALKLYRKHGFTGGEAFADYAKSEFNQFLHLELNTSPRR